MLRYKWVTLYYSKLKLYNTSSRNKPCGGAEKINKSAISFYKNISKIFH